MLGQAESRAVSCRSACRLLAMGAVFCVAWSPLAVRGEIPWRSGPAKWLRPLPNWLAGLTLGT
jgi:hypothetical protein